MRDRQHIVMMARTRERLFQQYNLFSEKSGSVGKSQGMGLFYGAAILGRNYSVS